MRRGEIRQTRDYNKVFPRTYSYTFFLRRQSCLRNPYSHSVRLLFTLQLVTYLDDTRRMPATTQSRPHGAPVSYTEVSCCGRGRETSSLASAPAVCNAELKSRTRGTARARCQVRYRPWEARERATRMGTPWKQQGKNERENEPWEHNTLIRTTSEAASTCLFKPPTRTHTE